MPHVDKFRYDTATLISQGRRERQEDAIISDFPTGSQMGFVVLADGMGGHDAGDVASKIVVTEVFSELKLRSGDPDLMEAHIGEVLHEAAHGANDCVSAFSDDRDDDSVMGATLLAPVLIEDRLFWISVGDSPLYLMRDGVLRRLNEDHAIGSQIDYLVTSGLMRRDEAENYPDQNCLTSVIVGREIPQIDCPDTPFQLIEGDILIAASDGLLVLSDERIAEIIRPVQKFSSEAIGAAIMGEIEALDDPHQDNVTFCVVKVLGQQTASIHPRDAGTRARMFTRREGSVTIVASVSGAASAAG